MTPATKSVNKAPTCRKRGDWWQSQVGRQFTDSVRSGEFFSLICSQTGATVPPEKGITSPWTRSTMQIWQLLPKPPSCIPGSLHHSTVWILAAKQSSFDSRATKVGKYGALLEKKNTNENLRRDLFVSLTFCSWHLAGISISFLLSFPHYILLIVGLFCKLGWGFVSKRIALIIFFSSEDKKPRTSCYDFDKNIIMRKQMLLKQSEMWSLNSSSASLEQAFIQKYLTN